MATGVSALAIIAGVFIAPLKMPRPMQSPAQPDVGQPVQVLNGTKNGSARVLPGRRDAELESADMPRDGTFYIAAVRGSSLVLTHLKSQLH